MSSKSSSPLKPDGNDLQSNKKSIKASEKAQSKLLQIEQEILLNDEEQIA